MFYYEKTRKHGMDVIEIGENWVWIGDEMTFSTVARKCFYDCKSLFYAVLFCTGKIIPSTFFNEIKNRQWRKI